MMHGFDMYENDMNMFEDDMNMNEDDMSYGYDDDENMAFVTRRLTPLQLAINYRKEIEKKQKESRESKIIEEKNKEEIEEFKKVIGQRLTWGKTFVQTPVASKDDEYPDLLSSVQKNQEPKDNWVEVKQKNRAKKDKEIVVNSNICSKMCNNGSKCMRGGKCNFAHTRYELKPLECSFAECKNVILIKEGKYINRNRCKCERLHIGETMVSYYIRNNLRDNVSKEDMIKAYEEFESNSKKISSEELKILECMPSNRYIKVHDVAFFGKQEAEKKIENSIQTVKYKKYVQKIDYYKKPRLTGGDTVISNKEIKFIKEDQKKKYIKEKNRLLNDIRSLKSYILADERAIDRLKTNKYDILFVKKREDAYKSRLIKLKELEKELSELKIEKDDEVVIVEKKEVVGKDNVVVVEKKEVVRKDNVVVVENNEVLTSITIIPNKSKEMLVPDIVIPVVHDGWKIVVKKHKKSEASSPVTIASIPSVPSIKVPTSVLKTQMCRSVESKTPCPHGNKCRYAHNEKELVKRTDVLLVMKTQMCKSVVSKINCPHGDKCRYAHSFAELKVQNCSYGSQCKMVEYVSGEYINTNMTKTCCYKHPEETKTNFMRRNKF